MDSTDITITRIIVSLARMSILKTAYFSLKSHGPVIVGRKSRLRLEKGSRIIIAKGGLLTLGIKYNGSNGAFLEIKKGGTLRIEGRAHLMKGDSVEIARDATLTIGDDTFINENTNIICHSSVTIGSHCAIGWGNNILDSDLHYVIKDDIKSAKVAPVIIGDHVWTGLNVVILKGVTIGNNSVVAAGSMVTKDIPEHVLSAGSPARVISTKVDWSD
jgi:acetyltransferase-like isoleucine patch superfamily enzyme